MTPDGMTDAQAHDVYDILVEHAGAPEGQRGAFVHAQTRERCVEWRFQGHLGFGGKFWRTTGWLPDGSWGEVWNVNCYSEHETPERRAVITVTNRHLERVCMAACA